MSKLSGGQFAAFLLITDAFTLFCLMGNVSVITCAAFLTGILLQFGLSIPAIRYYSGGGTLKNAPKPVLWFYLLYIILWGGLLFVMLWNASEELSIPSENFGIIPEKLLIAGLIGIVCLYASSPEIHSLARAAVISAALGAFSILLVIISSFPEIHLEYLTDLSYADSFISELSRGFVLSGGLGSFVVFSDSLKGSHLKCAAGYFAGKALLYTVVILTSAAVAGGIMEITDYPVIMAAELSQPFTAQRIDSLFLIIFAIFAVFSIAVQTTAASSLISALFPSFTKFRSTAALAAMTASAFLLSGTYQYSPIYGWAAVAALAAVPVLMLIKKESGRRS